MSDEENNDDAATRPANREPGFAAIFETAVTSGLGAAAAALPTLSPAAIATAFGIGATAGGITQTAAQARARYFPTADERVEEARDQETETASLDVQRLQRELDEFRTKLGTEVRATLGERALHRVAAVGHEVLRRIHAGEVDAAKLNSEHRDALVEAMRFSLDALRDEVVPMIARLVERPVDHFFRGTCRVLVDLDADELGQLTELTGAAAHGLADWVASWEHDGALRTLFTPGSGVVDLDSTDEADGAGVHARLLRWRPIRESQHVHIPADSQLVALLIAHRLGRAPDGFVGRVTGDPMSGIHFDQRVITMPIRTILDLHFVLTGERIVDPRATPAR